MTLILKPVMVLRELVMAVDGLLSVSDSVFSNTDINRLFRTFYPPFAERIGEVFILLYVFLFVFCSVNDFSATRGSIHVKFCMRS